MSVATIAPTSEHRKVARVESGRGPGGWKELGGRKEIKCLSNLVILPS